MYLLYDPVAHGKSEQVQSSPEKLLILMERISSSGDKAAFEELFVWFAPKVKALMMKQDRDADLAEDLMQETMLTVWNKAAQFSSWRGSVSAWVFTIARNKRIDRFRKQGVRHFVDVDEYDIAEDVPDSEDKIISSERDKIVAEATMSLPEDQRQIITMSFIEDLTQMEIAEKLGIPLGTVKSRTRLAYQKIRKNLEDVL